MGLSVTGIRGINPKKFRGCATCSAKPLSSTKVEKIITLLNRLEEVEDAGTIARILG